MTVGVDVDELHAETAAGASRVRAPQHRAVSLAPSGGPAIFPRTFMDPSSCAGPMTTVFPFPATETGIRERNRVTDLVAARTAAGRSPKAPTAIKARPVSGADVQWPVQHRDIRLTE